MALAIALALAVTACGGDTGGVQIDGAWVRTSPSMATAGAAYMNITVNEDDQLLSASVDSSIAATAEVHETVMAAQAGESMSDDTVEGMGEMMMLPVDAIALPAGETVALEPGGYHIMLLDLAAPLETGNSIALTLAFANAGERVVTVEIRDSAP
jgi:hypothetical protein